MFVVVLHQFVQEPFGFDVAGDVYTLESAR